MLQTCANPWCRQPYEVSDKDLRFLEKVSPVVGGKTLSLPPPDLCYDCRQQRRLAGRNERNLYRDTCDLCKRAIVSIYAPGSPHTVYCPACWWSDAWDPFALGREFDFSRSFFEQFKDLWYALPKISILALTDNINSDYAHDGYRLKNCYMIFDGEQAQDSYFGELYAIIKDCCDFLFLKQCELCYECVHCQDCFSLIHSRFCQNCSDSAFLLDCSSCRNCIGCVNLAQKEYHIFNQPVAREEFEKQKAKFNLHTHSGVSALRQKAEEFFLTQPRKAFRGTMNEESFGDNIFGCKNVTHSFDCLDLRDCSHCTNCMMGGFDCQDVDAWGDKMSLVYNSAYVGAGAERLVGCYYCAFGMSDTCYSTYCLQGANDCFGCAGIKKVSHCILNKKYSKEEYEKLVVKIYEHMKKTGEWGAFYPPWVSAFGYNETVAQDYYPLSRDEVLKRGWNWREPTDEPLNVVKIIEAESLPDSIDDVPDDILNWAIKCEKTGKPFKLQKAELDLYRRMRVPVPRQHFEVRHAARRAQKNPRKLWNRNCAKCKNPIVTSYSPEKPEIVYCEACYLKEVY